jgi:hypothetical protein
MWRSWNGIWKIVQCKGFAFSHRQIGERSEVVRLGRSSFLVDDIDIHTCTWRQELCHEWLETIDPK